LADDLLAIRQQLDLTDDDLLGRHPYQRPYILLTRSRPPHKARRHLRPWRYGRGPRCCPDRREFRQLMGAEVGAIRSP
jgi:hypothetical protein